MEHKLKNSRIRSSQLDFIKIAIFAKLQYVFNMFIFKLNNYIIKKKVRNKI